MCIIITPRTETLPRALRGAPAVAQQVYKDYVVVIPIYNNNSNVYYIMIL